MELIEIYVVIAFALLFIVDIFVWISAKRRIRKLEGDVRAQRTTINILSKAEVNRQKEELDKLFKEMDKDIFDNLFGGIFGNTKTKCNCKTPCGEKAKTQPKMPTVHVMVVGKNKPKTGPQQKEKVNERGETPEQEAKRLAKNKRQREYRARKRQEKETNKK